MPIRPIVLFPDIRLRQPAAGRNLGPDLAALARDVLDTLVAASAIGLTAPHIGVASRVMVIRMSPGEPVRTYVDPTIAWASDGTAEHEEGSVSMPGVRERIARPESVRVRYRNLDGVEAVEEASGFAAAVLQHEIDQLDGIFWIDRLSKLKRDRLIARYAKLRRRDPSPNPHGT